MQLHVGQRRPARLRKGTATVEFALTAPILFMLVMASIEFSRANVLLHTAKVAVGEGARRGIVGGTTTAEVEDVVRRELSVIGVKHATVLVHPPRITEKTELVAVGVAVPVDHRNGYVIPRFFVGESVWKVTAVPREAKNDPSMQQRLTDAMQKMETKLKNTSQSGGNDKKQSREED